MAKKKPFGGYSIEFSPDGALPPDLEALLLTNFSLLKLAVNLSKIGDSLLTNRLDLAFLLSCELEFCLDARRVEHRRAEKSGLHGRQLRALGGIENGKRALVELFIELKKLLLGGRSFLRSARHGICQLAGGRPVFAANGVEQRPLKRIKSELSANFLDSEQ
jgi:hypothetical protein